MMIERMDNRKDAILHTGNVQVTKTIVRVGNTTYPVNGIGSVPVMRPDQRKKFAVISAMVLWMLAVIVQVSNRPITELLTMLIIPTFVTMGMIVWIKSVKSVLFLRTASGDIQAVLSPDIHFLRSVQDAIEEAVSQRG